MKFTIIIIAAALAATAATPVLAQSRGAWRTIGSREVGFGIDTDKIAVRGSKRHRQIRVCAARRDFTLLDVDIRYANGSSQDGLGAKRTVRAGTCTSAIDLRGTRRDIREVKLDYSRFAMRRIPIVTIQAR